GVSGDGSRRHWRRCRAKEFLCEGVIPFHREGHIRRRYCSAADNGSCGNGTPIHGFGEVSGGIKWRSRRVIGIKRPKRRFWWFIAHFQATSKNVGLTRGARRRRSKSQGYPILTRCLHKSARCREAGLRVYQTIPDSLGTLLGEPICVIVRRVRQRRGGRD